MTNQTTLCEEDFLYWYRLLDRPEQYTEEQWATRIHLAAHLSIMAGVYPGDPDNSIGKEIAELLCQEWEEPNVIITFDEPGLT